MIQTTRTRSGFTLIEVLLALTIFAISILGIVGLRTSSLRSVNHSERLNEAVSLARKKMAELELKYQAELNKSGAEATYGEDNGTFDEPWKDFSWKVVLSEPQSQLSPADLLNFLIKMGMNSEEAEKQIESQKLLLTNMNKIIKENFVEMKLEVKWLQFGKERSIPIVTHIIPAKPRFQLTMQADGTSGAEP